MKKQLVSILLIAGVGLFLSSCSNLSKTSLTKRHYRSGYYVELGTKVYAPTATTPTNINRSRQQISYPTVSAKPKEQVFINILKGPAEKFNPDQKNIISRKEVRKGYENMSNSSAPKISSEKTLNQAAGNTGEAHAEVNVNVPYVLIIICAIFIPPLGVGLMYGINSYFWIDLILTLLFFFPGMIFALIVVLM
jgi:uncharacterized membrane protein YqaE (UPF0057 family)